MVIRFSGLLVFFLIQAVRADAQSAAPAEQDAEADSLSPVVVTATRVAQPSFDLPVSIDRVGERAIAEGAIQENLSETLNRVPGVQAQMRQNYAQDLQLSIRGFGARSSFGVRGVRLYSDGIPGTMPDGQGQFSHFELGSADHIEVLRGPFSALYGNSSGGVIAVFTQDGKPGVQWQSRVTGGSFDTQRYATELRGQSGAVNYLVDVAHFQTDGYREHSHAERNSINAKVRIELDARSKLTLIANGIQTPAIQDPLGLNRAQLQADPTQAGTNADRYDTRKSLTQGQLGAIYDHSLSDADDLAVTLYGGHRTTTQYQAILTTAQALPSAPGGVIALGRNYEGMDAHITDHRDLFGTPLQTSVGASYDRLDEARRGYLNFVGDELGVEGALRRREANHVYDFDQYLQVQWDPSDRWRGSAGVRHSVVDVVSHNDLALAGANPESGVRYSATNPVAGVTFRAAEAVNLYASYGKGFETPTLNDLAYRSTNGSIPGLNLALQPARSDNYEVGVKTQGPNFHATLAAFYVSTHHELAVQSSLGGRSVYQNIDSTERRGAEVSVDGRFGAGFSGEAAYTYLRAVVADPYTTCVGLPCVHTVIPSGNRIPAVPANSFFTGLTWREPVHGISLTLETIARAKIFADDRNSDAASAYWLLNARAGLEQKAAAWHLSEFFRIDNIAGRRYVGSVIVNDTNSRFFEPEPGRAVYAGFTAEWRL